MKRRNFVIAVPAAIVASVISPTSLKAVESETPASPKELNAIVAIWSDKYQTWFSYFEVDLTNKGFASLNEIDNKLSFCAVDGNFLDVHIYDYEHDIYTYRIPLFKPQLKNESESMLECIEAYCDDAGSTENDTALGFKYGELFGGIVI